MQGWNTSALKTLSGFWGEICRNVSGDALSPYNAAFQALLNSNNCQFFIGSVFADFDFEGMAFNLVPDTLALQGFGGTPSGQNLTPAALAGMPFSSGQYAQAWPLWYTGVSIANTGAGGVAVATGSGFQTTTHGGDGGITGLPAVTEGIYNVNFGSTLLTVASIQSDTQLTFTTAYSGAPVTGADLCGPFNSFTPPGVEGDHHQIVVTISTTTGMPSKLYEGYNLSTVNSGTTWTGSSAGEWDLVTGAQNPTFYGASSAAGLPYWPLMPTGDEVFVQGVINHALPITLGGGGTNGATPYGLGSGGNVFPAPTSNVAVGNPGAWLAGGVPLGGRLRLKSSFSISAFMAANPSATAATQTVLTALQAYGAINVDWTAPSISMGIQGAADARWIKADVDALQNIPMLDFELIDTVRPRFSFSGPSTVVAGAQATWLLTQDAFSVALDSNYQWPVTVSWSNNGGSTWSGTGLNITPNYGSNNEGLASNNSTYGNVPGPFTITFTPPASGSYLFSLSQSSENLLLPLNFGFTAGSTAGAAYTSTQTGDWSLDASLSTSPWHGGSNPAVGIPGAGDTVTINHNVAVRSNQTIGTGAAATVLSGGTSAAGSLTITGATLTIRGNSSIGVGNGYNLRNVLIVQSIGPAPGGIVFDGNSGVTPVMSFGDDTLLTITGNAAAPCFVQTKAGSAGGNGWLNGVGSEATFFVNISYCAFSKLGSATQTALNAPIVWNEVTPTNAPFLMNHCTIDSCGTLPALNIIGDTINCQITNCTWTNGLLPQLASIGGQMTPVITSGTRLVDHCVFNGVTSFYSPGQFTITNSYMWDLICSNAWQWAGFDGNFWHRPLTYGTDGAIGVQSCCGDVTNCYFFADPATENGYFDFIKIPFFNTLVHGNVFHYEGAMQMSAAVNGEGNTTINTHTYTNNIYLPNSAGTTGLSIGNLDNNPINPQTTTIVEHNTACLASGQAALFGGSATSSAVNTIGAFKSNLFYGLTTPAAGQNGILCVGDPRPHPDQCPASAVDYNGWYRMQAIGSGTWTSVTRTGTITTSTSSPTVTGVGTLFEATNGSADELYIAGSGGPLQVGEPTGPTLLTSAGVPIGVVSAIASPTSLTLTGNAAVNYSGAYLMQVANPNASDNTIYNSPMTGTTPPGVHDVANVFPNFMDPTRNLFTWDASLHGAGTAASAVARIKANLSLTKTSLIPYIRAGFTLPNGSPYLNAGHDGQNIGAV